MMSVNKIPIEEINFHPTSFCDRNGRVFWWKGELYRGITSKRVAFYQNFFASGMAQKLIAQKLLVATELTELTSANYPLILKHQRIAFVSYANEWCPAMLKDCALCITKLMLELAKENLTLADVCTFDIMFDGCHPVYVDYGSLDNADQEREHIWERYNHDFRTYFIEPLRLMSKGYGNLARWISADYDLDIIEEYIALMHSNHSNRSFKQQVKSKIINVGKKITPLIPAVIYPQLSSLVSALRKLPGNKSSGTDLVQQLWQELDSIPLGDRATKPAEANYSTLYPSADWTQKQIAVHKILSDLRPATVLDIGSSRGWYSQLAATLGSKVVALDIDEGNVTQCYRDASRQNLSVLPLVMNIRDPSPGHGVCNKVVTPAFERLNCELVLALGIVHILVFEQYINLEQISETFAAFSQRWLLVEFYSSETQEVKPFWSDWHSWYTLDNFRQILTRHFDKVTVISPSSQPKVLILCER